MYCSDCSSNMRYNNEGIPLKYGCGVLFELAKQLLLLVLREIIALILFKQQQLLNYNKYSA